MTTRSSDPLPLLDAHALAELRDMIGDALTDIGRDFLAGLEGEVSRIAAASSDAAALRRAAHSLKGSAGNMGAVALAAQAADIEALAAQGELAAAAARGPELAATAQATRLALQAHLGLG